MGIAERFKQKIEEKNIFENKVENELNSQNIKFISKPVEKTNTEIVEIENSNNIVTKLPNIQQSTNDESSKNSDILENEILFKISKTPYWNEFSNIRKEKMIGKYFEKRIDKIFTQNEKSEFVKNIIIKTTK